MIIKSIPLLILALFSFAGAKQPCDEILYVPENLQSNVQFWKMIYGRIGTANGVIHDIDSLRVVYDTIEPGRSFTPARRKKISESISFWSDQLKTMAVTDRNDWNVSMKKIEKQWGRTLTAEELVAAAERVRHQQGMRERFAEGIKRSGRYLAYIKSVFEKYNLPEELAFLPHVESSFDYTAYSKVGAAGIWQFMRGTGKQYLRVGNIIDERLDPMKATVAAAKLLSSNYRKLNSWPLAITAYNHGAKSMADAVALHGTTDIGVIVNDYQRKSFKFASKNFYASFVAAYRVASNHRDFFGELELYPPAEWVEKELASSSRPTVIADKYNVTLATLKQYNLDIRPSVFNKNLALPKGHLIKLPGKMEPASEVAVVAEPVQETLQREIKKDEEKPKSVVMVKPTNDIQNVVQKADTAKDKAAVPLLPSYLLSEKKPVPIEVHGTAADAIYKDMNFWYSAMLAISNRAASSSKPCYLCPFDSLLYDLSISTNSNGTISVNAQIDETIHHLADWAGVSYKAILAANKAISKRGMRIGEKVIIPIKEKSTDLFSIERLSHHIGIEEDFFNNYKVTGKDSIKVTSGGQIWAHSMDNDIPFWLVMKANPQIKNWNVLRPQQVYIPVIAPVPVQ